MSGTAQKKKTQKKRIKWIRMCILTNYIQSVVFLYLCYYGSAPKRMSWASTAEITAEIIFYFIRVLLFCPFQPKIIAPIHFYHIVTGVFFFVFLLHSLRFVAHIYLGIIRFLLWLEILAYAIGHCMCKCQNYTAYALMKIWLYMYRNGWLTSSFSS